MRCRVGTPEKSQITRSLPPRPSGKTAHRMTVSWRRRFAIRYVYDGRSSKTYRNIGGPFGRQRLFLFEQRRKGRRPTTAIEGLDKLKNAQRTSSRFRGKVRDNDATWRSRNSFSDGRNILEMTRDKNAAPGQPFAFRHALHFRSRDCAAGQT